MNRKFKKNIYLKSKYFVIFLKAFTFDQFNASLLNKSIKKIILTLHFWTVVYVLYVIIA